MARAAQLDPQRLDHQEWLGFVRPTGLVVSATALSQVGVILQRSDRESQDLLCAVTAERLPDGAAEPVRYLWDFAEFARRVLGWSFRPEGYAGVGEAPIPDELVVPLPDFGETLRPDFAVRELQPEDGGSPWQLLVRVVEVGLDLDQPMRGPGQLEASFHGRMERLLRRTGVPAGLLCNGYVLRLISAPRGESSGHIDFVVRDMVQTAGRPIAAAMRLLLSEKRLLTGPRSQRLAGLLADSRKFQNEVSEKLASQVLHGLYELVRGIQAADDDERGGLLREVLAERPDDVYHGLLTVLLRLVFLLYAEERGMLPDDETFVRHYSLAGLYERLREDAALHPDTMDQRYGAWAQLLTLFRMLFDGAETATTRLPRRHGELFDPDRFPFLEGRTAIGARQVFDRLDVPLVSDGTIYRVLEDLLILEGERISYRALDVEQIGSVYETMMGFRIETATGTSLAIKAKKTGGAPTTIDLDALLAEPPAKRAKWLVDHAHCKEVSDKVSAAVKAARSIDDLDAALDKIRDRAATPDLVARGALVLQPSEARRKSGSHYTPRELTEPIVRTTLRPILERLREEAGGPPTPAQILDLKVCDPAMGSGAFLVETCRQLGDALIEAWEAHDQKPVIPGDEDEVVHARRLVAQRCLYGVDRNPMAVDLAKVSLWLITLARDHAFTFVDHALRHGDSLVGLTNQQIAALSWDQDPPYESERYLEVRSQIDAVLALRRRIREADEATADWELRDLLDEAEHRAAAVRTLGDLVIEAFFAADKDKQRALALAAVGRRIAAGLPATERARLDELRLQDPPLAPFHWELEFPEVFDRERPGMDAFVGNPPYAGRTTLSDGNNVGYIDWLQTVHAGAHGNADLVAHMFRRAFLLLRSRGTLGLIATNTIAQGDTRGTGLRWIIDNGGAIYEADRRRKWPGRAAVVVSVVHMYRGEWNARRRLDGAEVDNITAYLFYCGGSDDPYVLGENSGQSFQGAVVVGMGFTFDDTDRKGVASSLAEMERLMALSPNNSEVIFPYIGGAEVNDSPTHEHYRYVINFGDRGEAECRRLWPDLMRIAEGRVKTERDKALRKSRSSAKEKRAKYWWKFSSQAKDLYVAITGMERVLVCPGGTSATKFISFVRLPARMVYDQTLCVFSLKSLSAFPILQCRLHEVWARFFGGTLEDRPRYNSSRCFETFPFPEDWQTHPALEAAGQAYYDFRAQLMVETDLGLTKTYNRFHDPDEDDPQIVRLRELHAAMDRAVLDAYGWIDVPTDCEFLLDYEDEEDDGTSRRKKPWRYRWPDEVRDDVLARLLELNAERAAAEREAQSKPGGLLF